MPTGCVTILSGDPSSSADPRRGKAAGQAGSFNHLENDGTYTAREWDADAKLFYYRARWYDPSTGRFYSEDPAGFGAGDTNLYRHVGFYNQDGQKGMTIGGRIGALELKERGELDGNEVDHDAGVGVGYGAGFTAGSTKAGPSADVMIWTDGTITAGASVGPFNANASYNLVNHQYSVGWGVNLFGMPGPASYNIGYGMSWGSGGYHSGFNTSVSINAQEVQNTLDDNKSASGAVQDPEASFRESLIDRFINAPSLLSFNPLGWTDLNPYPVLSTPFYNAPLIAGLGYNNAKANYQSFIKAQQEQRRLRTERIAASFGYDDVIHSGLTADEYLARIGYDEAIYDDDPAQFLKDEQARAEYQERQRQAWDRLVAGGAEMTSQAWAGITDAWQWYEGQQRAEAQRTWSGIQGYASTAWGTLSNPATWENAARSAGSAVANAFLAYPVASDAAPTPHVLVTPYPAGSVGRGDDDEIEQQQNAIDALKMLRVMQIQKLRDSEAAILGRIQYQVDAQTLRVINAALGRFGARSESLNDIVNYYELDGRKQLMSSDVPDRLVYWQERVDRAYQGYLYGQLQSGQPITMNIDDFGQVYQTIYAKQQEAARRQQYWMSVDTTAPGYWYRQQLAQMEYDRSLGLVVNPDYARVMGILAKNDGSLLWSVKELAGEEFPTIAMGMTALRGSQGSGLEMYTFLNEQSRIQPYTAGETLVDRSIGYIPTSGISISAVPYRTTTILGVYRPDTEAIMDELWYPKSTVFTAPAPGGYNLLNVPNSVYNGMTTAQWRSQVNGPFLEAAWSRGDAIIGATPITWGSSGTMIRQNRVTLKYELTGYGWEYLQMRQQGYHRNPVTGVFEK